MRQSEQERLAIWLTLARQLRDAMVKCEAEYFRHLAEGEKDVAMWRCAGYPTFLALLKGEDICDAQRYDKFKAEVAEFGYEMVRTHGVGQMAIVLSVPKDEPSRQNPDKPARAAIIADFAAFREERGNPASLWQAKDLSERHYERPAAPRVSPVNTEILALKEALAKEKAKGKALAEKVKAGKVALEEERRAHAATKKELARLVRLHSADQAAE